MIVTGSATAQPNMIQRVCRGALERAEHVGEQVASCPLGQILFRGADRVLWTAEATVKWFAEDDTVPQQNGSTPGPCLKLPADMRRERPLPWVLFLPLLVWLRIAKLGIEVVAFLRGKEPLRPSQVVRFIQSQRRRLRALKYQGLKNFRSWQRSEQNRKQPNDEFDESVSSDENEAQTTETPVATATTDPSSDDSQQTVTGSTSDVSICQSNNIHQVLSSPLDWQIVMSADHPRDGEYARRLSAEESHSTYETRRAEFGSPVVKNSRSGVSTEEKTKTPIIEAKQPTGNMGIENNGNKQTEDSNHDIAPKTAAKSSAEAVIREENEDLDDSSSTISLDSAESCSETTSQTYYSPTCSSPVGPEPNPTFPVSPQEQHSEPPAFRDRPVPTNTQELQTTTEQKVKTAETVDSVQKPAEEMNIKQTDKIAQVPATTAACLVT